MGKSTNSVKLSVEERVELEKIKTSQSKEMSAETRNHAKILLLLDENGEKPLSPEETGKKCKQCVNSIYRSRKRYVQNGIKDMVFRERGVVSPLLKVTGEVEAHIIATACSQAPEGHIKWTLQQIADKIMLEGVIESISDETVRRTLKKTSYSLTENKCGAYRLKITPIS